MPDNGSRPDSLEKLNDLLNRDWDEDDRISVVVNTMPAKPSLRPSLMPQLPAQWKSAIAIIVVALGAIAAAMKAVADAFSNP